jgi:nicotinic acid phosphoribosyltransferase
MLQDELQSILLIYLYEKLLRDMHKRNSNLVIADFGLRRTASSNPKAQLARALLKDHTSKLPVDFLHFDGSGAANWMAYCATFRVNSSAHSVLVDNASAAGLHHDGRATRRN